MADRLEKFIKGSMAGIFDSQSNINLESSMTVFSTKDLEETLRPIAFYMILDFIWTTIRRDLRKRILIVEEAWYLMQNADSARFIYGIAKRARKYYLGLTTVSQDVDDFLTSEYGKAVVTNSSIQMLFKQHPAAIDKVVDTFYLSEGEKRFLLSAGVGEGLFFAGANHVAIRVMASEAEHKLITTNPEEVLRLREERRKQENKRNGELNLRKPEQQVYKPYKPPEPMDEYKTFDEKGNVKPEYEAEKILGQKVAVGGNSGENVSSVPVDNAFASKDPMSKNIVLENNIDNARTPRTPQRREQVNLNSVNREKNFASNEPLNREVPGERVNKTNLDSRVIELRRKMLQEDDSFMNGSPSAEDILESVEEMKKKKQGIGRINGENAISEGGSGITSRTMGEENKANNILDNSSQNQKSISETGNLPINTGQN
jgi:hypothetical protein